MQPIAYRKLESADAVAFRRVRLDCLQNFPESFGTLFEDEVGKAKLFFEEQIENGNPNVLFFGAFDGNELVGIVGFVRGDRTKTRHRGEIVSMYVDPRFHGQNVGEQMLRALIEQVFESGGIESLELTVVADNGSATRLYERVGFETYGLRKKYFKSGETYTDQRFMLLMRDDYAAAKQPGDER